MMAILVFGAVGLSALLFAIAGPCQFETPYHCGWIEVDDAPSSGRTLILDRLSNSYVDLDDPEHIQFRYLKTVVDIINTHAEAGPLTVVAVGGGGFTLPGYVSATRPGSNNIVLEIDRGLVEIGQNHLALRDDVDVVIADARQSIRDIADNSVDVVVGDAFSGYSVPWHLTTVEFLTEISRVLTGQGLYAMNVIDFDNLRFVRSAAATMGKVFDNVIVFAPSAAFVNGRGGNFVLAGSDQDFDLGSIQESMETRNGVERVLDGQTLVDFIGDAHVLTDDYAPVDQMLGSR